MTVIAQTKPKFGVWIVATILSPVVIMSVELWVTRHFNSGATDWDLVGMALSVIVGICCLWQLPMSISARVWLALDYVPVSAGVLMFYSLFFVCTVFGDCL